MFKNCVFLIVVAAFGTSSCFADDKSDLLDKVKSWQGQFSGKTIHASGVIRTKAKQQVKAPGIGEDRTEPVMAIFDTAEEGRYKEVLEDMKILHHRSWIDGVHTNYQNVLSDSLFAMSDIVQIECRRVGLRPFANPLQMVFGAYPIDPFKLKHEGTWLETVISKAEVQSTDEGYSLEVDISAGPEKRLELISLDPDGRPLKVTFKRTQPTGQITTTDHEIWYENGLPVRSVRMFTSEMDGTKRVLVYNEMEYEEILIKNREPDTVFAIEIPPDVKVVDQCQEQEPQGSSFPWIPVAIGVVGIGIVAWRFMR